MNRDRSLHQLADESIEWDFLIIGGGATGLGTAVDAASRGYRVALVEQADFAKGTSSRSTKLVHGGVRYLKQGDIHLVRESLHERGLLLRNAPHLAHPLSFVIPAHNLWEKFFYGIGLKVYDALAGRLSLGRSRMLSRAETLRHLPTLQSGKFSGGVQYFDGQFDDARLAVCLAQTLHDLGGVAVNYCAATSFVKAGNRICGAVVHDSERTRDVSIRAKVVINATGIFTDSVRRMDDPKASPLVLASQGTHVVLDRDFLPGESALMVPTTDDERVLFAIPWHGRVVVGTTDTPRDAASLEPKPLNGEIDFILQHAGRYLSRSPQRSDILSTFAGQRPLFGKPGKTATSHISREHALVVSPSALVTITGGKWTTYRAMAEQTVDHAEKVGGLVHRPSKTQHLRLHGAEDSAAQNTSLREYGSDAAALEQLMSESPALAEPLHPRLPNQAGEVIWAARHEMARTVEDVLARRMRALFLDARAALDMAPTVAALLAKELQRDVAWQEKQLESFHELALGYLPHPAE